MKQGLKNPHLVGSFLSMHLALRQPLLSCLSCLF
nr:MAG TPA: hypothetical protein [Caudoviricetes sp.]